MCNYSDLTNMVLVVIKNGSSLYTQLGSNPLFKIYPKGNHQCSGKKIEIEFTFEFNNNLITGLSAEGMGQRFKFKKDFK